ncbi:hypothetical protein H5410_026109 [Solanum commersonii]|uniref:Uncharacterized protein n=1 Tax=Solanum commersonii TaxID=4109 RepID=A0A9J5YVM0_SOLCO|nr:hypothetical protein H5410_026109 [Solanum commersonii]
MDEVNKFSIEEGLHLAIILKFSYGKPDLHEFHKICFAKKKLLSIDSAFGKSTVVDKATQERTWPSTGRVKNKSNKKEEGQLVPDDNAGERRDSRNNLGAVKDATVDRAIVNSSEEATTFNSNNA